MLDGSRPLLDLLDHVRRLARTSETRQRVRPGGVFDEVLVFDFQSLYPSIIRTFNIDPLSYAGNRRWGGPDPARHGQSRNAARPAW